MGIVNTRVPRRGDSEWNPWPLPYTRDRAGVEAALIEKAIEEHGEFPVKPLTFVYFMQAAQGGGPIKIGVARDPIKRKTELQVGSPVVLRITRVVIAHPEEELRLHRVFRKLRLHGEWFQPHPSLAELADAEADPSLTTVVVSAA